MAEVATITTSAPGSLMLLGEHAVLHGHRALVCAINRRITVELTPTADDLVAIVSHLGTHEAPREKFADHPAFTFVSRAIRQWLARAPSGFRLRIDSEFSADIGFGSSAAVTVATHAALARWIEGAPPRKDALFQAALATIHAVQGRGSGADLAAAVHGGVVGYTTAPSFDPVAVSVPLTAVYCGYKTPTPEVISIVEKARAAEPEKFARIHAAIDADVEAAVAALRRRDFPGFGEIMNRGQELMNEMGVNTPELAEIVAALQAAPQVFGAKISGSGLGDCAAGIGHAALNELNYPVHHLEITPEGCQYHES